MKYIEVTGWGNHKKHLLPLNKIIDFTFEDKYTTLSLISGTHLNITETKEQIEELLNWHGAKIVNYDIITQYEEERSATYERMSELYMNDDELPF
jgi:DNA-binding LytR/AlgR family response regulator